MSLLCISHSHNTQNKIPSLTWSTLGVTYPQLSLQSHVGSSHPPPDSVPCGHGGRPPCRAYGGPAHLPPGICKTFDYREVEGLGPCIELEWVDGGTLAEFYAHGPVDITLECQLFTEICDALAYVHHKQIYHRDLKPENILVTHNGSHIKLIDFGLSDSDTHAVHKESAGTVVYAAPEVLRGEPADARSDIYSLGRILFEVSDRHTSLALRCMDRRPEKRPSSAEEVKAALLRPRRRWIGWIVVAVLLIASVLAGGYFFARGTHPAEPAPAVSSDKSDDNTSDVDALFEEVSNQIIDAQKKSN